MTQAEYIQWLESMGISPAQASQQVASLPPTAFNQFGATLTPPLPPGPTPLSSPLSPAAGSSPSPNLSSNPLGGFGGAFQSLPGLAFGLGTGNALGVGLGALGLGLGLFGGFSDLFSGGLDKTAKTSAVGSGLAGGTDPLGQLVGQYMSAGANAGNPLSNPAFGSSVEQVASMLEALTNQQVAPITINSFDNPVHWQASPVANVEKLLQIPAGYQPLSTDPATLQAAYKQISQAIPYTSPLSGTNLNKDFNQIVQRLISQGLLTQTGTLPSNVPTGNVASQVTAQGGPLGPILGQYLSAEAATNPTLGSGLSGATGDVATLLQNLTGQTLGPLSFIGASGKPTPLTLGQAPGSSNMALPQGYEFLGTDPASLQSALQVISQIVSPSNAHPNATGDWQKVVQQLISQGALRMPGQTRPMAGTTETGGITTTQGLPHPLGPQPGVLPPYPLY